MNPLFEASWVYLKSKSDVVLELFFFEAFVVSQVRYKFNLDVSHGLLFISGLFAFDPDEINLTAILGKTAFEA